MQRIFVILAVAALSAQLQACVSSVNDLNPFTPRQLSSTEVVQTQFPNIFVPKDMSLQSRHSGTQRSSIAYGVQVWTGNYALGDMGRFMQNLLTREGWKMRLCLMHNDRALQEYERQGVRAVLRYVRQSASLSLEIWVGNASTLMDLPVAAAPAASTRKGASGDWPVYDGPTTDSAPAPGGSGGGLQERPL